MTERLGIIDFRNIIRTIKETYDVDFSDYALTSFKRRLEKVVRVHNMNNADELIERLKEDKSFFSVFLQDISVEDTEMFRDPSLWRELRDVILPKLVVNENFKIWLPSCTSGEELFTLMIILRELAVQHKVRVVASSLSTLNLEFVQQGIYDLKKMEVNTANYKRYKGRLQLSDYYEIKNNKANLDLDLIKDVEFIEHDLLKDKPPSGVKMIVYRNKLIYFNLPLQNRVIKLLYDALHPAGYFIIGIKETIESFNSDNKFIPLNENENIFKRSI